MSGRTSAPALSSSARTREPLPWRVSMSPERSSRASEPRSVVRLTPWRSASSRSGGRSEPAGHAPPRISADSRASSSSTTVRRASGSAVGWTIGPTNLPAGRALTCEGAARAPGAGGALGDLGADVVVAGAARGAQLEAPAHARGHPVEGATETRLDVVLEADGGAVLPAPPEAIQPAGHDITDATAPGRVLPGAGPAGRGERLLAPLLALLEAPLEQRHHEDEQREEGDDDEAGVRDDLVVGLAVRALAAVMGEGERGEEGEQQEARGEGGDEAAHASGRIVRVPGIKRSRPQRGVEL